MTASSAGWTAAANAWRGETADTEATRLTRYWTLWGFYFNDPYDETVNDFAQAYKSNRALYTSIKPLYNPVSRLVEFYVAKIAGGPLALDGREGALPIVDADPATLEAVLQVWKWSNWGRRKNLWVRYGAALGDAVVKVVEDQKAKEVQLQLHWPGDLVDADFDRHGRVTYAVFEYVANERNDKGALVEFTYKEVITPEQFTFYKNGEKFDYVNGVEGGEKAQYANEYGFVPVVVTRHKSVGTDWGACAFHYGLPKIDQLNDLASHLGDQIRKAIHPQWVSFGTRAKGSELERSDKIWHHPKTDGNIMALVEEIDIEAVSKELQERLREIERDFPELKAYELSGNQLSGRAIAFLLGDVVDRVVEARGNYYASLVEANRMALRIGGLRSYWPGGLGDEFEHGIGETDVFPMDNDEAMGLESQQLALDAQRAMMTGG